MLSNLRISLKMIVSSIRNAERTYLLLKNILISFLGRALNLGSNFVLIYLIVNAIGKDAYGVLAVMMSISIFFTYADLGLASSLVNSLSEADSRGQRDAAKQLVAQIWIFLWGIAAVIATLTLLGFLIVEGLFPTLQSSDQHWLAYALFIGGTLIGVPLGIDQRIYFAMQRGDLAQLWMLTSRLAVLLFAFISYSYSPTLVSFTFTIAFVPALISAISCLYVFKSLRPDLNPFHFPSFSGFGQKISTGLLFAVLNFCTFLEMGLDPLIFAKLFGTIVTADNDILIKLLTYVPALANLAVTPLWPAMAAARAAGDYGWIVKANRVTAICVALIGGTAVVFLAVNLDSILTLWLSHNAPHVLPQKNMAYLFIFLQTFGVYQLFTMNALNLVKQSAIVALMVPIFVLPVKILAVYSSGSIVYAYLVMTFWYAIKIPACQIMIQRQLRRMSVDTHSVDKNAILSQASG
ncbi:oligosaccharide flippase family protein [Neorhizobium lilium]